MATLYKDGTLDTPAPPYNTLITGLLQVHPKVVQGIVHEAELLLAQDKAELLDVPYGHGTCDGYQIHTTHDQHRKTPIFRKILQRTITLSGLLQDSTNMYSERNQIRVLHWGSYITSMSQTQEWLTKIHTICVEIRNIKRTSQKQYIKTPFKGQGKNNP